MVSPISTSGVTPLPWDAFLATHALPTSYRASAERWFLPLVEEIARRCTLRATPLCVGLNGCQGSGKSTLAALLALALPERHRLRVCVLSIDDFYLTRAEREALAAAEHPLFATRGVPGTHDVSLMAATIAALRNGSEPVRIPRFDKARDDRLPDDRWSVVDSAVDVIVLEGWCVGVAPEPENRLAAPVNTLEADEDASGIWRRYVNARLAQDYQPIFEQMDFTVMLAAPGFDCVERWRGEQEHKLMLARGSGNAGIMRPEQIRRFVQFYQRLTEWGLETLPQSVDCVYPLDAQREVLACHMTTNGGQVR